MLPITSVASTINHRLLATSWTRPRACLQSQVKDLKGKLKTRYSPDKMLMCTILPLMRWEQKTKWTRCLLMRHLSSLTTCSPLIKSHHHHRLPHRPLTHQHHRDCSHMKILCLWINPLPHPAKISPNHLSLTLYQAVTIKMCLAGSVIHLRPRSKRRRRQNRLLHLHQLRVIHNQHPLSIITMILTTFSRREMIMYNSNRQLVHPTWSPTVCLIESKNVNTIE